MSYRSDLLEIDVIIRKYNAKPTVWTGERGQEPEKELTEELKFNKLYVREAIQKLAEYIFN